MSAVILEVLRTGVRVRPPVICPADKDEFSVLMNHLNTLVEEICSGVHTSVRLRWCTTCIPALKYLAFLFLFALKTLGGKLGGEISILSPPLQRTRPGTTDNTTEKQQNEDTGILFAAATELLLGRDRSVCKGILCRILR